MPVLEALPEVEVTGAELQRRRHRLLLVVSAGAREMEVHAVRPHRLRAASDEAKAQLRVLTRQKCTTRVLGNLTAEHIGPELNQTSRVVRVEGHCLQSRKHARTIDAGPRPAAGGPG